MHIDPFMGMVQMIGPSNDESASNYAENRKKKEKEKRENVIGEAKTPRIRDILISNVNLAKDIQKLRY